jgi:uncharacterized protein YjbI with pentapeptide repeats
MKRCRRSIASSDLPEGWGGWSCWRPSWEGYDECIWHAESTVKPYDVLRDAWFKENTWPRRFSDIRTIRRLDEAHLRNLDLDAGEMEVKFEDKLDSSEYRTGGMFNNLTMFNSKCSHTDFSSPSISLYNVYFTGADLSECDFSNQHVSQCVFTGANLRYAIFEGSHMHRIDFDNADMKGARINDVNLYQSNLNRADLAHAEIADSYLAQTEWRKANLEGAEIADSDLRDADFTKARSHELRTRDIRLNEGTDFGEISIYETEHGEENLTKGCRVYRMYQRLLREASLPDNIRHYRIRERECRRKLAKEEGRYFDWFRYGIQRWSSKYGESVQRVLGVSGTIVGAFAFMYPLTGFRDDGNLIAYGSTEFLTAVSKGLYFSMMTFTTLGYGDIQPVGFSQMFATVEAALGAILIALLVFVLGRQATW